MYVYDMFLCMCVITCVYVGGPSGDKVSVPCSLSQDRLQDD